MNKNINELINNKEYKTAEKLYLEIIELDNRYLNAYINLGNLKRDLNPITKLYASAL